MFDSLTAFELGALRAILGNSIDSSRRTERAYARANDHYLPDTTNDGYLYIRAETSEILRDTNRSLVRNQVIAH